MRKPGNLPSQSKKPSGFRRRALIVAVNLVVVAALLCSAELFYRWYSISTAEFEWECFEYDKALGWVPKPGHDDEMVLITPDRFRATLPPGIPGDAQTILACGDSFTFGNHVRDNETWSYYLSEQLKARVINAGVSGYGLDQTILRLARILPRVHPDWVVISLVYDDIRRCELSKRSQYKPYYDIIDGRLVLRNLPVPSPITPLGPLNWFEKSLIIRKLLLKRTQHWQHKVHDNGLRVARALCREAKKIVRQNNSKLVIIFQPNITSPSPGQASELGELEKTINRLRIPFLNLIPVMRDEFEGRAEARKALFVSDGHMSPAGNKWLAGKLATYLRQLEAGSVEQSSEVR